jgi:hypothetical protein
MRPSRRALWDRDRLGPLLTGRHYRATIARTRLAESPVAAHRGRPFRVLALQWRCRRLVSRLAH